MAAAKMNSSHGHTHPHAIEVHDEESGDLGVVVVEEGYDPTRMKCATTRCGLESTGSLAADVAKRAESSRTLSKAVVVCLVFMAVEVAGGVMANSLAIFTDAAHMLTDVAGFAISLFAIWASGWEATPCQTFGFARLEILGALGSILLIWLLTGILAYEAIHRLFFVAVANAVDGRLMFIVATLGLLVNLAMMYLLGHNHGHGHGHDHGHGHGHDHSVSGHNHSHEETNQVHTAEQEHEHEHEHDDHIHDNGNGSDHHNHSHNKEHKHSHGDAGLNEPFLKTNSMMLSRDLSKRKPERNINVQGAYLHVLGDLLQSVGVMIGGAAIWYNPKWKFIDPVCTLLFSILVLATTIKMIRDILGILMESTPREIDAKKVESGLLELPGVVEVHDLHIWAITVGKTLLACHVRVGSHVNTDEVLQTVTEYCETKFKITHVTIQIERDF